MPIATIVWPNTLPSFAETLARNYGEDLPDNVYRLPMDSGSTQTRPRTHDQPDALAISLVMTRAQSRIFDTFRTTTTVKGSRPFRARHPRLDEDRDFLFSGRKRITDYNSVDYVVSFRVVLLNT